MNELGTSSALCTDTERPNARSQPPGVLVLPASPCHHQMSGLLTTSGAELSTETSYSDMPPIVPAGSWKLYKKVTQKSRETHEKVKRPS